MRLFTHTHTAIIIRINTKAPAIKPMIAPTDNAVESTLPIELESNVDVNVDVSIETLVVAGERVVERDVVVHCESSPFVQLLAARTEATVVARVGSGAVLVDVEGTIVGALVKRDAEHMAPVALQTHCVAQIGEFEISRQFPE